MRSNNKSLLITMGDPAGVGPEVTAKALAKICLDKKVQPVVIGNGDIWQQVWPVKGAGKKAPKPSFIHVAHSTHVTHKPGVPTPASGKDALLYLEKAVELIKAGQSLSLVTAPVSKESISRFIPGFKGHTTYFANAFGLKNVEMLFVADDMKLVLVTRHVPLKAVPALITTRKVLDVIQTTHRFIVNRFKIKDPKIAVLGLNPHAGEGGHIGNEEIVAIVPAIKKARALGMNIQGPFPADTFFEPRHSTGYDLVVALYHDQALTALKALYFDRLVNVTVGLPFIRTSPAHGTAFGIAGRGIADEGSMLAALQLAVRL